MVACASMVMPQLAPTSDGGVVVAIGGKLVKYNSTLHKVGEVNIEIDWTEVQQRVEQIVQNCPMHRRFLQQYGQVPTPPQAPFPGQAQGTPPAPAPGTFQGQQPR